MPSAPIECDKKILYKKPKNFSHVEKTDTKATVLKNLLIKSPKNIYTETFYSQGY